MSTGTHRVLPGRLRVTDEDVAGDPPGPPRLVIRLDDLADPPAAGRARPPRRLRSTAPGS